MMIRTIAAALLTAALLLATPKVASAHDDVGVLDVVTAEVDGLTVRYDVALIYSGDREPVAGATVTVVAQSAAGVTVGPVNLESTGVPGHYAVTLEYPSAGDWTVRFTSITPRATVERPESVAAADAGTATTPVGDEEEATTSTSTLKLVEVEPDEEDSSATGWLVLGGVCVALAAIGALIVRSSRKSNQ